MLVLVKAPLSYEEFENLLERVSADHVCSALDDLSNSHSIKSLISDDDCVLSMSLPILGIRRLEAFSLNNLHLLVVELDQVVDY